MPIRTERVDFKGAHGLTLAARLDRPLAPPRAYALFAHCFTCSKDIFAASRIAQALADCGIATLRFDFTGLGHSEGEFANTNFSSNIEDLVAAADFLRAEYDAPKVLVGHSLGGAAVLAAAPQIPEAQAVATIGAPADPGHVAHLVADARGEIEAKGEAEVTIAGRAFRIQKQFLEDIEGHQLSETVAALKKALLVFHAPRDQTVGIENAGAIFAAAKHPKSFVSLDTADHLLSKRADAAYVGAVLAAWAERYVETAAAHALADTSDGEAAVAETREGRFPQIIAVGSHRLRADEPESVGGFDSGPTPYDLLLAALGSCTSMTMRLYADRKKIPLDRATVRLRHEKIHAEDCAECETKEGKIDRIERQITLEGDLTDENRAALLRIADRCPVHRTLHSEVKIVDADL